MSFKKKALAGVLVETLKSPVDGTVMMVNQMPAIKDGQSVMAIGVVKSE